jgi:hypothetical protein
MPHRTQMLSTERAAGLRTNVCPLGAVFLHSQHGLGGHYLAARFHAPPWLTIFGLGKPRGPQRVPRQELLADRRLASKCDPMQAGWL